MRPLVTPEEMRRADEAVISSGVPAEVLMERAGRAVARAVLRELGGRYGRRVTVVCGKGNNGGDGFVVARVLLTHGIRVACCTTFDPEDAKGAALHHLGSLREAGGRIERFDERFLRADVIVDAVFGTGFRGDVEGDEEVALHAMEHIVHGEDVVEENDETIAIPPVWPRPRVVSVDVPSAGIVPADVVVALGAEKLDTFFGEPDASSVVEVADIGIAVADPRIQVIDGHDIRHALPHLRAGDHKTSHGSVVVIAGSDATTGAPMLTARAAARMGAGYVTLVSTPQVIDAANVRLPEVLKQRTAGPVLGPGVLDEAAAAIGRADAVAMGPGFGTGDEQTALVERALRELDQPLVLDADALNVMVGKLDSLVEREWPTVITPHAAEMARLLRIETADVLGDRPGTALRAAEEFGCVVVLKGPKTLVAGPSGGLSVMADGTLKMLRTHRGPATAWAVPVGGPELATAGTGDVLTGAIAATLARGVSPQDAAAATCYVHGVAGALAGEAVGATGVVAWDVGEALSQAVRALRASYPG